MTIRIGEHFTEIEPHDALPLRVMADRVANDRPSFRRVLGRIGDEAVEIYTFRRRDGGERLAVRGPCTRLEIGNQDRAMLDQLLADMA